MNRSRALPTAALAALLALAACEIPPRADPALVPLPAEVAFQRGDTFHVSAETPLVVDAGDAEAARIAGLFATWVGNQPGERPAVLEESGERPERVIRLTRRGAPPELGPEGYLLTVDPDSVVIRAPEGAGLFYGIQTLRQLLPPAVEYEASLPVPLPIPGARVSDAPRYPFRGAMLDVARHFLPPEDVKRFVDLMALHKLNALHLGLSNDQGWRIEVPGWPDLTRVGGSTEVGGGPGGFYTLEEYADLVRYAGERFITVIPEIDMPGHTNAALASYAELNCDGVARELYTGIDVGFSTLCVDKALTWAFVEDVVREVAAATPGPWFHVGGDEVPLLPQEDYAAFMERAHGVVSAQGKAMVAWDEAAVSFPGPGTVIQLWRPGPWEESESADTAVARARADFRTAAVRAQERGARFILSPASRFYLDMKEDGGQVLGLRWAGVPSLRDTYDWDPGELMAGIAPEAVLGVEAPLWTETVANLRDAEHLAFPRLAAVAEFGWTPQPRRDWWDFRRRLGAQSARWIALGMNFRRSPDVPWDQGPPDP